MQKITTKISHKKALIFAIAMIFIGVNTAIAQPQNSSQSKISSPDKILQYVPDEIIVKLKEEAQNNLSVTNDAQRNVVSAPASLNKLNKKHRVRKMTRMLGKFRKKNLRLKRVQTRIGKVEARIKKLQLGKRLSLEKEQTLQKLLNRRNRLLSKKKRLAAKLTKLEEKRKNLRRLYRLKLGQNAKIKDVVAEYQKDPNVEYAEPNYIYSINSTVPNDTYFYKLWGLHNTGQSGGTSDADIDAPQAWDITTGSREVVVAVIDTGVDYNHKDLAANMWTNPGETPNNGIDDDGNGYVDDVYGIDAYNNDSNPMDDHGHGTHVAGTIGAVGNDSTGVVGVNWKTSIMSLKFMGSSGVGSTSKAITCIEYAVANGAYIMSNSWGGGGYSQALRDAIEAANAAGILFIAAAGNDSENTDTSPHYPSGYDNANIISVAATDRKDKLASFSNYGATSVDVAAPGVSIYSCLRNNSYGYKNGTSMATPHVAGLAALIWAEFGLVSADEVDLESISHMAVKASILSSVDQLSSLSGKVATGGRINAYKALMHNIEGPYIYSLSPNNGIVGQSVTISGINFGDAQGTVTFYNGLEASITSWSGPQIECTVPVGATTGELTITTTGEGTSNGESFTVCASLNTYYRDADNDEYGDPENTTQACIVPEGYVENDDDCDDTDAAINPEASEVCDGVDNDCDEQIDEGVKNTYYRDADEDDYGDPGNTTLACTVPDGYLEDNTDCDDADDQTYPGAPDVCDSKDNDCDEEVDEGVPYYRDADEDGYGDPAAAVQVCPVPADFVADNTDCDDTDAETYPGAPDVCDGKDNNCDGEVDEGGWWTVVEDTRLTSDSVDSKGSSLGVDSSGNAHIAWMDYQDGNYEIYYTQLNSAGNTVVEDIRVTSNSASSLYPSLGVDSSSNVHIAWYDYRDGNLEIYYTQLDSAGNTVVEDTRLTSDSSPSSHPSLGVSSSGNVHIAWRGYQDGNYEIYYTQLNSAGNTVVEDTRLTSDSSYSSLPSLGVSSSGNVHIAWEDYRDGNPEIYYTQLDSAGNIVREDTRLTYASFYSYDPSLGVDSSGNVHIAWNDRRDGNYEIYYTQLASAGNVVVEDTRLTSNSAGSYYPSLGVSSSGNVHIAWNDRRDGNYEIYYTQLDSAGNTVVEDIRLTSNSSYSHDPSLGVSSSGNVHIAWEDRRDGNYEIYHTKGVAHKKALTYYRDVDKDGYSDGDSQKVCTQPEDYYLAADLTATSGDCDDGNAAVHPGVDEHISDGIDNNCNGFIDECSFAWEDVVDDTRLTSNSADSWGQSLGVDSSGNVHIVWEDYRDGNGYYPNIYYTKLDNSGNTLVEDIGLTLNDAWSNAPSLGVSSSGNIHIAWEVYRDGLYYTQLDSAGNTVVEDTCLISNSSYSYYPSLGVSSSGNVHIAWYDRRDGNPEIYYTQLNSAGNTVVEDTRLTSNSSSYYPSLGVDSSGNVHIAWYDSRDGNYEIYYTKLDNSGNIVVDDTRLTSNSASSYDPSLGVDSYGNVHIAWMDRRDGNLEIYYTKLDNLGNTVIDDTRLTSNSATSVEPHLNVSSSGNIHIAWRDSQHGNLEIYYTMLDNAGNVVIEDTRLTSNTATSASPSLGVDSSGNVHIAWHDYRDGNAEIYYTQGITHQSSSTYYRDLDGDGYGNPSESVTVCSIPSGYVSDNTDTDDDADDLLDTWEYQYLGGLSYDSGDDPDQDGHSNLTEYNNGWNPLHAPVIYRVKATNTNDNEEDGSKAHPYDTIEEALVVAEADDVVKVAAGTYQLAGNLDIPEGVKLRGKRWYVCRIDLDGAHQIQLGAYSSLIGFEITGPHSSTHAILAQDVSSVTITNNVIQGHSQAQETAAIFLDNSSARIENNTIDGGHFGIRATGSTASVYNNIIVNTEVAILRTNGGSVSADYNNLWDSNTTNYVYVAEGTEDISTNPLFVDADNGNYHLKNTSPCRDTGHLDEEYNDKDESRNDMGADGGPDGVQDTNRPKVRIVSATPDKIDPLVVDFVGTARDEWGIASWSWDFDRVDGIGQDSIVQNPSHTYDNCGKYIATLTVTDHSGRSVSTRKIVVVGDVSEPTVVTVDAIDGEGDALFACAVGDTVIFSGSAGGSLSSYTWIWDFGDQNQEIGDSTDEIGDTAYVYNTAGGYTVTLTVTDDYGCHTSGSVFITVVPDSCTIESQLEIEANTITTTTLSVSDAASGIYSVAVEIPPEAIPENTVITISEVDQNDIPALPTGAKGQIDRIGMPVDFGPDGIEFSEPVTIRIPYDPADIPLGMTARDLRVYYLDTATGNWVEVEVTDVDDGFIYAQTDHFSTYTLAVGAPSPPNNLSATAASESRINLSWDDNSSDEDGFSIERSADGGVNYAEIITVAADQTSYSDTGLGLSAGTQYCYRVLAYKGLDFAGYSNAKCATTLTQGAGNNQAAGGGGGGGGGGGCFIATAAYGTSMDRQVKILSLFRDKYLLRNSFGRGFVDLYYKYSPPIAEYIAQKEILRRLVRTGLWPLVIFALFMVKLGLMQKLVVIVILSAASGYLVRLRHLKKVG